MTAAPMPAPRNSRVGSNCPGRDQTFPASKNVERYSICDTRMPSSPVIVKNAFPNAFGKAFFTMTGELERLPERVRARAVGAGVGIVAERRDRGLVIAAQRNEELGAAQREQLLEEGRVAE